MDFKDIENIKKNIKKIDDHINIIAKRKFESWNQIEKLAVCYNAKKCLVEILERENVPYKKELFEDDNMF